MTLIYPHLHLAPPLGMTLSNFSKIFGVRKLESLAIVWRCLPHPILSVVLVAILVQNRLVTDRRRHTDRHGTTAKTALSIACAVRIGHLTNLCCSRFF